MDNYSLSFDTKRFIDGIKRLKPFQSREETRYYLNGIYLHHADEGKIKMVATCGQKLGIDTIEADIVAGEKPESREIGIISRHSIDSIIHAAKGSPSYFYVDISRAEALFCFGDTGVKCRFIDGTYPDYERVIPGADKSEYKINLGNRHLKECIKALGSPSSGSHLTFTGKEAPLIIDDTETGFRSVVMPRRD